MKIFFKNRSRQLVALKKADSTISASTWLFFDRLIRLGLGFVTGVLIARHYGPIGNGVISLVVSSAAIFGSIASLGIDEIGPIEFATKSDRISAREIQCTSVLMRIISGIVAYGSLLLTIFFLQGPSLAFSFALIFGIFYSLQAFDVVEYRLRSEGDFKSIAIARSGASIASSALKIILVLMDLPVTAIAWAMLAEYAFSALYFGCIKRPTDWTPQSQGIRIDYAKEVLSRSSFLILAGTLSFLQSRVDNLMVEHYLSLSSLGQYTAAMKLMELFDTGGIILSTVLVPSFARSEGHALDVLVRRAYLAGVLFLLISLPLMVGLYFAFDSIYGLLYAPGKEVMVFLFLRPFFVMLAFFRVGIAVVECKHRILPLYAGVGFLLSIGFGSYLIPSLALKGAALTHVLSLALSSLLVDALLYRKNLIRLIQCPREFGFFLMEGRRWIARSG